jgi:hypothetical protein
MNDLPGVIEQLVTRVESLERRVSTLERQSVAPAPSAAPQPAIAQPAAITAPATALEPISTFSVLGRAMLGIAGAYLLRAAAQSNLLPSQVAAAIAIPYAVAWLVFAVRARAGAWFPATVYSAASALILAPMLWELTFRFQIIAAPAAAAVIAVYVSAATILALTLASPRTLAPVLWVANLAAVFLALSLFFVARSTTPFIAVLLLMLALAAYVESRNHAPGIRSLTALAASTAIWAAVYVYISPPNTRPDFPSLNPAVLIVPAFILFALFLASVVDNTVAQRHRISIFEIIQTVIAFLLAAVALDAFGPQSSLIFFGILCLILAAAGYAAVYLYFDRAPAPRNYRVFSTWSAALVIIGSALCLPGALKTPCFGLAAVAAIALGSRFNRFVLVFHGAAYLAATAAASGLALYTLHALAGALPAAPSWSIFVALVFAIACYFLMRHPAIASWQQQTLLLLVAALVTCAAAALVIHGLISLAALRFQPGPHHLAFFRTLSLCAAALALAWAGARLTRVELTRIANAALVLLAVKLVAEDLRHGHLAYISASIFLYALTLIAVPRVSRLARNSCPTPAAPPTAPSASL